MSTALRGSLEEIIEIAIEHLPIHISEWRSDEVRKKYQITHADDFVYGFTVGQIISNFVGLVTTVEKRTPRSEEIEEAKIIVFKRIPEIKKAIFDSG